jgi:hypothetical protein
VGRFPGAEIRTEADGAFRQFDLALWYLPLAHACVDQDVWLERVHQRFEIMD